MNNASINTFCIKTLLFLQSHHLFYTDECLRDMCQRRKGIFSILKILWKGNFNGENLSQSSVPVVKRVRALSIQLCANLKYFGVKKYEDCYCTCDGDPIPVSALSPFSRNLIWLHADIQENCSF